jgi:glutamine synthetase
MGVEIEKHHHEVAAAQHELVDAFNTLTFKADEVQLYKYVVHNVAHAYGKTVTFMPKPVFGDNGSGMHVHQSIWGRQAGVRRRRVCRPVRNLPLLHWRHHQARQGAERLHQPVDQLLQASRSGLRSTGLLAYSARNRSASCRIPFGDFAEAKRVEIRFPDPTANPYLAFAAMLMAGLDGMKNKIHPGEAMDKDLYDLPPEELKKIPTVCGSLREALESLDKRPQFLKPAASSTTIRSTPIIELKMEEVMRFEMARTRSNSTCTTNTDRKDRSVYPKHRGKAGPAPKGAGPYRFRALFLQTSLIPLKQKPRS